MTQQQPQPGRPQQGGRQRPGTPEPRRRGGNPRPPAIAVTELTPVHRKGLKAFASVRIGRLTLHQWRVCEDTTQGLYVLPPATNWTEADTDPQTGKVRRRSRFRSLVDVPPEWQDALSSAVLLAWQRHGQGLRQAGEGVARA